MQRERSSKQYWLLALLGSVPWGMCLVACFFVRFIFVQYGTLPIASRLMSLIFIYEQIESVSHRFGYLCSGHLAVYI